MDIIPRSPRSTSSLKQTDNPQPADAPATGKRPSPAPSSRRSAGRDRFQQQKDSHPDAAQKTTGAGAGNLQPVEFHSILYESAHQGKATETLEPPAFFADLNLDQIIGAITAGREEYDLRPFFHAPLHSVEEIEYRHEIMQDLEGTELFLHIQSFAQKMRTMREYLGQAEKLHYRYQRKRWFLDAAAIYCDAVNALLDDLSRAEPKSRGFKALRHYLAGYADSERFQSLAAETRRLIADLSAIRYCVQVKGSRITVRKYESETDYSAEVERTFEKFKQGAVHDYRAEFFNPPEMNHVEAKILDLVTQLYPDIFAELDAYCTRNSDFVDAKTARFDREIQFYSGYLEYVAKIRRAGLEFCYPRVSKESKEVFNDRGFDLALADKLIGTRSRIVCNDFHLRGKERILVVSGPNQGGKTTFARTFGQLHYLAALGCPVPGREAQLFLFDQLFAHFEKEEDIRNLRGKLQDDLVRMHDILRRATPDSIIIINEIFTSTTLKDALFLSKEIMKTITDLDLLCVCVTFLDELASWNEKTVSMTSTVVPQDPASRTYRIVRRAADGIAYALSIAEKHQVTYDSLKERIRS